MKRLFLTTLLAFSVAGILQADPVVPWAEPQSFPEQQGENHEVPLFERVMKEERRRKEMGIKETVTAESIKTSPASPSVNPTPEPVVPTEEEFQPLQRGAEGPRVQAVQEILIALGFALPAGADGDFGGQTEIAVRAFQSSADLPLTGVLDKETYETLHGMKPEGQKKVWEDPVAASKSIPQRPTVSNKKVRVLIDLSEHRLSVWDEAGAVQRVFPVASGAEDTPTDEGIKVVNAKLDDPTELAEKLWPDSKGTAFGKRLIDLNWYEPQTGGQIVSDEELHGTYELLSIGKNASHGCVRLTNENIEWLYQNLVRGDIVLIRE